MREDHSKSQQMSADDSPPVTLKADGFPTPARNASRRMLLLSTVLGIGGVAAGVATQVWLGASTPAAPTTPATDPAVQALWDLPLTTVDGQAWDWAGMADQPLLINFWATWCPPCIEELPLLDQAAQTLAAQAKQRASANGQQHPTQQPRIVLIAIDTPSNVQRFLTANRLQLPSAIAGGAAIGTTKALGNTAGGLPFSILLSADRRILQLKTGQLSEADILSWLGQLT